MSHVLEYVNRINFNRNNALQELISKYNESRDSYLFVYDVALEKTNVVTQLNQDIIIQFMIC
jgi:hypothetical protein